MAKGSFIAKRSRPDILLTIEILSGRVHYPMKDDWRKLWRLVDYLKSTIQEHLILRIEKGVTVVKWLVETSF